MKTIYYKLLCGYDKERVIRISDDELERAYGLFIMGDETRGFFKEGAVIGRDIQMILPDMQRTLGWNESHKIGVDDESDPRYMNASRAAKKLQNRVKERVQYLIENGRPHDIGKHVPIPELDEERSPNAPKFILKSAE